MELDETKAGVFRLLVTTVSTMDGSLLRVIQGYHV